MAAVSLSTTQIQQIFLAKTKHERRDELSRIIDFFPLDEDEDLLKGILLDFYHNNLEFAVLHGFPWPQVELVFQLLKELLEQSLGKSIEEAIELYKEKVVKISNNLNELRLKDLTDYVFTSFFQHYKLYQYVFTTQREDDVTRYHLLVEPPPPQGVCPLRTGVEKSLWDYQMTLKNLKEKAEQNKQVRQEYYEDERKKALELSTQPISALLTSEKDPALTKEKLEDLVRMTTRIDIANAGIDAQEAIADMAGTLESNYEQMMIEAPPGIQTGRSSSKGKPRSSKRKKT